jgi:hypothetical protein
MARKYSSKKRTTKRSTRIQSRKSKARPTKAKPKVFTAKQMRAYIAAVKQARGEEAEE